MFNSDLTVPDATSLRRLEAMRFVALMKESADRNGIGFVGGFIDPVTGEKFTMTNMNDDNIHPRIEGI